jgi:hypothetical protein
MKRIRVNVRSMANNAQSRRRWLGAIFLGSAVLTLVLGETLVRDPVGKLICWSVCLVSTLLAIVVAFWDLYAVRNRLREEQRELLEDTLTEIERQKAARDKTSRD